MGASNGKFVIKLAGSRVEKELNGLPDPAYKRVKEKILSLIRPLKIGVKSDEKVLSNHLRQIQSDRKSEKNR